MKIEGKNEEIKPEQINRNLMLNGPVDEKSTKEIIDAIIKTNNQDDKDGLNKKGRDPIKLIVNSNGGSVYDANNLIGVMTTSETPIYTYCHGRAMSSAFHIFISGHKRFATEMATFMYHGMSAGSHGKIEDLMVDAEWYRELSIRMNNRILKLTNIDSEILDRKHRLKEDWYMTTNDAYFYGVVEVIL